MSEKTLSSWEVIRLTVAFTAELVVLLFAAIVLAAILFGAPVITILWFVGVI